MEIIKLESEQEYWDKLIKYAKDCSWVAGPHLAYMLEHNCFTDWETPFAAIEGGRIVGYCTFMKTDYYPENRYSPWISSIFVDEKYRGRRISERLIDSGILYAKSLGFTKVYIPSDITGLYEKYGFVKIDTLRNYGGHIDNVFMKKIGS